MRILVAVPDLHRLDFALWYALASIAQLLAVPPSFMKEGAAVLSPRPQGYITMKGGSFFMPKKFFRVLLLCGEGLREILPQPISLYTHPVGWGHRLSCARRPEAVPVRLPYYYSFLLSFFLCLHAVVVAGIGSRSRRFNYSDKYY